MGRTVPFCFAVSWRAAGINFEGDIVVRISAEEYEAGGLHPEDMKSTVQVIEEAGAAAISVSSGGLNTGAVHAYRCIRYPMRKRSVP